MCLCVSCHIAYTCDYQGMQRWLGSLFLMYSRQQKRFLKKFFHFEIFVNLKF